MARPAEDHEAAIGVIGIIEAVEEMQAALAWATATFYCAALGRIWPVTASIANGWRGGFVG